jgi:hypothetical protein
MLHTGTARVRRSATIALLGLLLASAAGTAAAAEPETPEPPFCESHVLHDYLAPIGRMPELREPPFRGTGHYVRLQGARIASSGPPLAVSGGRTGYQINWDENENPRWDLTVTLARVDWRGRFRWLIGWRHLRLGELRPALTTEPNISLPSRPGVYKATLVIRSRSGRKLAKFGNYYRVIEPTVHARLAPSSPSYPPGSTLFARIENPGAAFVLFGSEYAIEKLEGPTWIPAPESPGPFTMPLYFVAPGTTSGHCSIFPIHASTPPGRYRISQETVISWPVQPHDEELRPRLAAEFDVVP